MDPEIIMLALVIGAESGNIDAVLKYLADNPDAAQQPAEQP